LVLVGCPVFFLPLPFFSITRFSVAFPLVVAHLTGLSYTQQMELYSKKAVVERIIKLFFSNSFYRNKGSEHILS